MKLKSTFKVSAVFKVLCLPIFMMVMMGNTFAMHVNLPFEEVAQAADLIFIGTVAGQESYFNQQKTLIITEVIFDDIVVVYGTGQSLQRDSSFITLKYAGGCVGDLCLHVSDVPSFREGSRYLLFVSDDGKTYINPVIGGLQGLFKVVKDIQTGEEFVLTTGRKSLLETGDQELIKSKLPVSYIKDGSPVYDMNLDDRNQPFVNRPPIPANPLDSASISIPGTENEGQKSRALTLSGFINYIRDAALKVPIENKILKKQGQGFFVKKNGAVIEKIPFESLINPGKNTNAALEQGESSQNQHIVPLATEELNIAAEYGDLEKSSPDRPLGGQLGACGYHSLYLVMEMVPEDWWSHDTIEGSMWIWNQFMDIYRITKSDGSFGHNDENEFGGWPDDSTLHRIYGVHWNGNYGWIHSWWRGNPCGRILESDILFNPAYNWTDDEASAIGNYDLILLRRIVMFGLANSLGIQRGKQGEWGYPPTYDYDYLTVMHAYYHDIVENGRGIHQSDAYLIRRQYSDQTGIENIVDVGVESYYADNGLYNSWTNSSSYYPGDSITLKNISIENNSYNTVSDLRVRVYLSSDRNITTQDYKIGNYWYWETFEGENRAVIDIDSTIPDSVPSGTYYIGVIVTVNGYNQDDFTYNNATSFYVTITIKSKSSGGNDGDGGDTGPSSKCFIATAAFNSGFHPYVNILRNFRDVYLMHSQAGRNLVGLYYKYSPFLANLISKNNVLKTAVQNSLLPVVAICSFMLQFD